MTSNMNLDDQKELWQDTDTSADWTRTNLLSYWSHPNLRSLRRQLVFETICWTLFLCLYYAALDGHLRSNGWNIALIVGLLALIAHGIAGYRLAGMPVGDAPLRYALEGQINTLKRFRWISIFLRSTGLLIFFGFMVSNIPLLGEASRLWLVGTILAWTLISVVVNYGIWQRHFHKLEETLAELDE
jgi:hypothetical protein